MSASTQTNGAAAPEIKDAATILAANGEQFGLNLPENTAMVVHNWTTRPQHFEATGGRPARDGLQINLDLSPDGNPENARDYHCFSTVLLRQLESIGKQNLPMKATFVRRPTQDGRKDETGRPFAAWAIKVD
jgi:hypothetical protein